MFDSEHPNIELKVKMYANNFWLNFWSGADGWKLSYPSCFCNLYAKSTCTMDEISFNKKTVSSWSGRLWENYDVS